MEQYLSTDTFWGSMLFALAICWMIKTVFDAVFSIQTHRRNTGEPITNLGRRVDGLENQCHELEHKIEGYRQEAERELNAHQQDLEDLHAGQSVVCRGVQALLDHALHNGNTDEMQAASDGIGKWLRTR